MNALASIKVVVRFAGVALVVSVLVQGGFGCGTESVEGGAVCTYGESHACAGPDGCVGSETCLPDLTGYTECTCDAGDAGADAAGDAAFEAAASDGGDSAP